ncbi:MAG: response regulator transcription factor [Chloroflexi bacterium]|nr:MAG: response regulator transcription factor [Chloroflexota bacterium]TME19461.1 MAG: response regulator transcription factor [Chloroflexota bacterium]
MSGRVLIVDDEQEIRRALKTGLGYQGFEVRAVATGEEALAEVGAWHPDVVLLDLGLPGLDGFEVLRRMPGKNRVAVMVVSVMPGEKDKVRALDLGADDYLVKPFGIQELSARIRAVLRRQASVGDGRPVIRARDLEVDLEHRRVSVGGRTVHLTPTEYEVLRQLAIHAGKPVTHTMLLREVWGEYAIGDRYNTRYVITQLRKKLGDDPARPRYISTEPGVGYRLEAD